MRRICWNCDGKRYLTCRTCNGTGMGDLSRCSRCDYGRIACDPCEGLGWIEYVHETPRTGGASNASARGCLSCIGFASLAAALLFGLGLEWVSQLWTEESETSKIVWLPLLGEEVSRIPYTNRWDLALIECLASVNETPYSDLSLQEIAAGISVFYAYLEFSEEHRPYGPNVDVTIHGIRAFPAWATAVACISSDCRETLNINDTALSETLKSIIRELAPRNQEASVALQPVIGLIEAGHLTTSESLRAFLHGPAHQLGYGIRLDTVETLLSEVAARSSETLAETP